jgi:hypothetical protein
VLLIEKSPPDWVEREISRRVLHGMPVKPPDDDDVGLTWRAIIVALLIGGCILAGVIWLTQP